LPHDTKSLIIQGPVSRLLLTGSKLGESGEGR
jgi:hypothetical protein